MPERDQNTEFCQIMAKMKQEIQNLKIESSKLTVTLQSLEEQIQSFLQNSSKTPEETQAKAAKNSNPVMQNRKPPTTKETKQTPAKSSESKEEILFNYWENLPAYPKPDYTKYKPGYKGTCIICDFERKPMLLLYIVDADAPEQMKVISELGSDPGLEEIFERSIKSGQLIGLRTEECIARGILERNGEAIEIYLIDLGEYKTEEDAECFYRLPEKWSHIPSMAMLAKIEEVLETDDTELVLEKYGTYSFEVLRVETGVLYIRVGKAEEKVLVPSPKPEGPKEIAYPAVGAELKVKPTAVTSANVWHGHIGDAEDVKKLMKLQFEINEATNIAKYRKFEKNDRPRDGDFVLAKYGDGLYYRGRIESSQPDKGCSVFFIDYGNTEADINVKDMLQWETQFNVLPMQAVRLVIANIEPIPGQDVKLGKQELQKAIQQEPDILVKVVGQGEGELHVTVGTPKMDIGEWLVFKKVAIPK